MRSTGKATSVSAAVAVCQKQWKATKVLVIIRILVVDFLHAFLFAHFFYIYFLYGPLVPWRMFSLRPCFFFCGSWALFLPVAERQYKGGRNVVPRLLRLALRERPEVPQLSTLPSWGLDYLYVTDVVP